MLLRFTDNLIMQLTRDCNLNCSYCFQGNKKEWKNRFMSYEDFTKLVDSTLYERCVLGDKDRYISFHFHGGEVTLLGTEELIRRLDYLFMRKEFFEGIHIVIQTNGLNIDEQLAEYFSEKKITVGVSFDSWVNDRMSEDQTRELMMRLKSYHDRFGTTFGLLSTITSKNVKTWLNDNKELLSWVSGLGVNVICTHQKDEWLIPDPEDVLNHIYLPIVRSWLTDSPVIERNTRIAVEQLLQELLFVTETENKKTGCFNQFCGHLSNMIAVDPEMRLTGCDKYLEKGDCIEKVRSYYDIDQKDFLGLNQIKAYFEFCKELNEARKEYKCDQCPADTFCPGECQSYALSKFGKVTIPEKGWCEVYKYLYEFVEDNWPEMICHMTFRTTARVLRIRNEARHMLDNRGIKLVYNALNGEYRGERIHYDL